MSILPDQSSSAAASELARLRWSRLSAEERSAFMKQVRAGHKFRKRLKKKQK